MHSVLPRGILTNKLSAFRGNIYVYKDWENILMFRSKRSGFRLTTSTTTRKLIKYFHKFCFMQGLYSEVLIAIKFRLFSFKFACYLSRDKSTTLVVEIIFQGMDWVAFFQLQSTNLGCEISILTGIKLMLLLFLFFIFTTHRKGVLEISLLCAIYICLYLYTCCIYAYACHAYIFILVRMLYLCYMLHCIHLLYTCWVHVVGVL